MIIVFPFIVLKYFSFCCHSSHSVLCCNRLVYSCFILIVKSDSNFNRNSSCLLSFLFQICLLSDSVYSLFFFFTFYFLVCICSFLYVFCLSCYLVLIRLSFLLLCLFYYPVFPHSVFLLLCLFYYPVFPLILSLCHSVSSLSFCLFSCFCRTSSPLFSSSFRLYFYSFTCLFFDIFAWISKYIKILLSFYFFVCLSTLFLFSFIIYVIEFLI